MANKIQIRRDTATNWFNTNPTLSQGELGFETNTGKLKIGDGATLWNDLAYFAGDAGAVDLTAVDQSIVPSDDDTYDLGSPTKKWRDLFVSGGSVYLGDIKLSNDSGILKVQQVTDPGTEEEAPIPGNPGVVTTDRLISNGNSFVLDLNGELKLNGEVFTADTGNFEFDENDIYTETGRLNLFVTGAEGEEKNRLDIEADNINIDATENINVEAEDSVNIQATNGVTLQTSDDEGSVRIETNTNQEIREWTFDTNGDLTLPEGGDIKNSDGISVLGGVEGTNPVLPYLELTNDAFVFEPYAGEVISFTKEDGATGEEATDFIDNEIAITRANQKGIYNPLKELQWDDDDEDGVSPVGTLWNADGWDDLTNVADRLYFSFYEVNLGRIGNNVLGTEFVMKDVANNTYYKFIFTVWTPSWQGASVTYTRTEIDPVTGEDIGEPVEFSKIGTDDPTQVNDPIDTDLTITRANQKGIYNIALETGWSEDGDGYNSPEGTLWNAAGWGNLRDVTTRPYSTFLTALGGWEQIGRNIVDTELVMWDTVNNKYWAVKFSSWTQGGNGGGFSYTRQLINTSQLFVKTDYGSEVDEISEGLHITRGDYGWLYNPLEEEGYDDDTPTNSLWNNDGWDDLSDVETRTYRSLADIWRYNFQSIPGAKMVMKDTTTDKYWAIEFLSWTAGNGGGFSYLRYELDLDQLNEGIKFADGTVQKTAYVANNVKSTAPGSRRIEEVTGYSEVTVPAVSTVATFNSTTIERPGFANPWDIYLDRTANSDIEAAIGQYGQYSSSTSKWKLTIDGQVYQDGVVVYTSSSYIIIYSGSQSLLLSGGADIEFTLERITNPQPQRWFRAEGNNLRGAIIDFHAYSQDAGTIIGTIHIARDTGNYNITHTETSSGAGDISNIDMWYRDNDNGNEREIYFRRLDGEGDTLKVQWIAKLFYGSEYYD